MTNWSLPKIANLIATDDNMVKVSFTFVESKTIFHVNHMPPDKSLVILSLLKYSWYLISKGRDKI